MEINQQQLAADEQIAVSENDVIQMLCRQISDMAVKIAVLEAFIQKGGGRSGHDPVPN